MHLKGVFPTLWLPVLKHFIPKHRLPIADNAAVITGQESGNQTLLNASSTWCTWSHMIIKVEKCH